jgi:hypothetical protein
MAKTKADHIEQVPYVPATNIAVPKGANKDLINKGEIWGSLANKLHLIKLANNYPANDKDYKKNGDDRFVAKTFTDLCRSTSAVNGAVQYEIDDFLYTKNLGFPINKMITLRRFPYPCTDNIYDKFNQAEPDIARMVTYFDQDVNKLEDLLAFSYNMKWKELTADMEQGSSIGPQSGFTGWMAKTMAVIDPSLSSQTLKGENAMNYDPKHDQNKVFGPVDSLNMTHIRDVGLEFNKEFDVTFEYEMRSIGGRTGEFAFKDIIANVLAVTYNNAKFWPGSRYWVGERPSKFLENFRFLSPESADDFLSKGYDQLKHALSGFHDGGSAIAALKSAMSSGLNFALGKLLDKVGRPSILVMNSLLSGEPVGGWHLMIGNPDNPIMCVGNLICTGTDISFPTDALGYGDFPTKLMVKVKLKPGMPKDKAGIETMFNMGKQRIYYNPTTVTQASDPTKISTHSRKFFGFDPAAIGTTLKETFDFVAQDVQVVQETVVNGLQGLSAAVDVPQTDNNTGNYDTAVSNASVLITA